MGFLQNLIADVAHAFRLVRRNPALSVAAILCLSLGIGANTSIFSVVNAVLFRPLPYHDGARLVLISQGFSGHTVDFGRVNAADYLDLREAEGQTFSAVALVEARRPLLTGDGDPEPVPGAALTPSVFRTLGVRPVIGREFTDADAVSGAPLVAILSDALWRRRYGADPNMVGRSIELYPRGRAAVIVGVMPPEFVFPLPGLGAHAAELFLPLSITPQLIGSRLDRYDWFMIGRLRDEVSPEEARTSLSMIARQLPQRYPETYGQLPASLGDPLVHVTPLRDAAVGNARRPLLLLLGAVGFVLLIACSNVASLVIARAAERRHEITIRRALGASQGRICQQFFAETLVLVCLGAALGVWIASWGGSALAAAAPGQFYRSFNVSVDGRVLGFTAGVTILVAVLFSILSTLHTFRTDVQHDLRAEGHSLTGPRTRQRALRALVVAEIALAMMLTVGAALMVRSFAKVHAASPGFDADGLVTFGVNFPSDRYADPAQLARAQAEIAERIRLLPGIEDASGTTHFPLSGLWRVLLTTDTDPSRAQATATNARVLPEFFETMRIPLLAGRTFTPRDDGSAPPVVIVNETLARQHFGTLDVVGQRVIWGDPESASSRLTIVGVVADVKQQRLDEAAQPSMYLPRLQDHESDFWRFARYVVRTNAPLPGVTPLIRQTIREYDPDLLVLEFAHAHDLAAGTVGDRRFNTLLFGLFAALALLLSATGVYGLMQYSVARRTREVGIRVALGARNLDVMRLIMGDGARLIVLGITIGLFGAAALTGVLRALLFEISPLDMIAFLGSALVLLGAALLSTYVPARRALRCQPTDALRVPI